MSGFDDMSSHLARRIFGEKAGPGLIISTDQLLRLTPTNRLGFFAQHASQNLTFPDQSTARVDILYDAVNGMYQGSLHIEGAVPPLHAQLAAHRLTDHTYRIDKLVLDGRPVNLGDLSSAKTALECFSAFVTTAWPKPGHPFVLLPRPMPPGLFDPTLPFKPGPDSSPPPAR